MLAAPVFASKQEYLERLEDVDFWWPYVAEALRRHGLDADGHEPVAGTGGTYPTLLCGDVVVKLLGHFGSWRGHYAAERVAHAVLATDPEVAAPPRGAAGPGFGRPPAPLG